MKDILQQEQTPYEILGIERGASQADIDKAFKALLGSGINVQKLTAARLALQRPSERALLDIFQYDEQVLSSLDPQATATQTALETANRVSTAAAWENCLKTAFPDYGAAHSLAVLYYWWAIHEEHRIAEALKAAAPGGQLVETRDPKRAAIRAARAASGVQCDPHQSDSCPVGDCQWREDCSSSAPPVGELWRRAVACWAMLVSSNEFWEGICYVPVELRGELKTKIEDRLRNKFHELAQLYRDRDCIVLSAAYRDLDLALSTEMKTARDIVSVGISANGRKVCCGRMVFEQLGMVSAIKSQIATALAQNPGSARLKRLLQVFSSHAQIATLIENKRYREALDEIERLPSGEQATGDAAELRCQALIELGKQQASLEQFDEALESWRSALACAQSDTQRSAINAEVVSTCHSRATSLQGRRREEAIALLEKALRVVADEKLRLTLAEIMAQQGVETFNNMQERMKKEGGDATPETLAEFEKGLAYLERAVVLGSKRAAEQIETARGILAQVRIPGAARAEVEKANEAAGRQDWDTAINHLRAAIKAAGSPTPGFIRENLAASLANRAINNINRGMELFQEDTSGPAALIKQLTDAVEPKTGGLGSPFEHNFGLANLLAGRCVLCSGDPQATINLPNGKTAPLCRSCAQRLQSAISNKPKPSSQTVSLLKEGYLDLAEAAELDPSSEHVSKNLMEARDVLGKLDIAIPPKRSVQAGPARVQKPASTPRPVRPAQSPQTTVGKSGGCWFCGSRAPVIGAAHEVVMHGNVRRTRVSSNQTRVEWQNTSVSVPRCSECKSAHAKVDGAAGIGAVVGILAGLIACIAAYLSEAEWHWLVYVLVVGGGVLLGGLTGTGIGEISFLRGTRPTRAAAGHPSVQKRIAEGWAVGQKPSGVS